MSENLKIWERFCKPPAKALKTIKAGRLKGMSDINPQWRLLALTELFGPCGQGWYTEVVNVATEQGADGTVVASVMVNLYWRTKAEKGWNEWSKPVLGVGGSMLVAKEKNGMHTSDEAFKMAETDAISVACKKLGIAGDIYLGQMDTKYAREPEAPKGQMSGQSNGSVNNVLDADAATGLVNHVVKLGDQVTSVKALGDLWKDNIKQINRLPLGLLADLTAWKDERKAELAK